jgi:hypothetical protein
MNQYRWNDLVTYNEHGECAAADVEQIVRLFFESLTLRKLEPELEGRRLAHQILRYIELRQSKADYEISNPLMKRSAPSGWTSEKERDWNDWIHHVFSLEDWIREVMFPVFGDNQRQWESVCLGWREDLFCFLPWWVKRSAVAVVEESVEEDKSELDPYLLEHGTAKQRRNATKGGE